MNINKYIKSFLIISILTSSIITHKETKANSTDEALATFIILTGAATICTAIVGIKAYLAYHRALKEYAILKEFRDNPYYDYERLTQDARNLYYEHCWSSSTSLSSDYPVVWLEKDATSNKNFLAWMFFIDSLKNISKDLGPVLTHLRNIEYFHHQKKEYNEKYREQRYRDDRISLQRESVNLQRESGRR